MQISNIHPNGRQISNGLRSFIFVFAYVNILEMKTKFSKQSSKPKQILSHFNIFFAKAKQMSAYSMRPKQMWRNREV